MHFKIAHKTTKTEATQRVKDALEQARPHMKGQLDVNSEKWEGNTFHFDVALKGKTITGTLEVTETDFVLDAKLPLMWRIFEGMIEKEIAKQVQSLSK
ncbi:MAG: polyhydroxyalkanoic acid system family protein [Minisyncoccia bacterium]